jgi:hypothetical protein
MGFGEPRHDVEHDEPRMLNAIAALPSGPHAGARNEKPPQFRGVGDRLGKPPVCNPYIRVSGEF